MAKKFSELRARMSPESKERADAKTKAMLEEMALAELRRARELSQSELARILGIRQPSVADMEKRTDMYISTLRSLIEGMGGQLDIIAHFPGKEVRIKNFPPVHPAPHNVGYFARARKYVSFPPLVGYANRPPLSA